MGTRLVSLTLLVIVASTMAGPLAYAGDPALMAWWKLDDGTGNVALDSSGNGHNGTIVNPNGGLGTGGSVWFNDPERGMVISFNGTDGSGACVTTGLTVPVMTLDNDFTWIFWAKQHTSQATNNDVILGNRNGGNQSTTNGQFVKFTPTRFECYNYEVDATTYVNGINYNSIPNGVWVHHAVVKEGASLTYYRDGVPILTNTMSRAVEPIHFYMGADDFSGVVEAWQGYLSDVRLYTRALTASEVAGVMAGKGPSSELAGDPVPEDEATDVPQDAALNWTLGEFAATHDVYLGTVFADVNTAGRTDKKGVLVSQGQAAATYQPADLFAYGQTYYWRIDEVNAAPDNTVFKGDVWSFTAEPYGYPVTPVAATASSFQAGMGPENTINGSGLTGDLHGVQPTTMWLSAGVQPNWIQYEFDQVYKLYELKVWNSNQLIESFLGFGAKNVTIETSADGTTWTPVADVPEFNRAAGAPDYAANTTVSLGGAEAKYVKLTINGNWGGVAPQTGLAEVQFSYVPVQARQPQPASEATDVSVDATLNWRPGREATAHEVLFGTDSAAVADGTVPAETVTEHSYVPASLDFGTTYYWKVNEVGAVTYPGEVWSFTTQEYAVIDDFESYTDQAGEEVFSAWIDGFTNGLSGSTVGYFTATNGTFGETTIVHSGKQSMPLQYDNTAVPFFSEAERTFASTQNWTGNGADSLVVYFRGLAPAFVETASGSILMNAIGADIWGTADQFRFAYKNLSGDGTMVARVDSVFNSNVWAKAGVMIRQSTDAGSVHAFMPITPGGTSAGNGASFQRRLAASQASTNTDSTTLVAAPYWVKIERKGNSFSGYISPDGVAWAQLGTAQTIPMTNPVLIGLALCSHDAAVATSAQFSNISTTGNVTGNWQVAEIGATQPEGNSVEGLYLAVTDSSGKSKVVQHPDAAATAYMTWQTWTIPLTEFTAAGVKTTAVKSLTLGVGNKAAPKAGGTGTMYIDDIGFGHPGN
jgi:hypothetical protein